MKVGRLLGTVVSILLMLSFIRTVNGAPFIGVSEVLVRLDQFEFDTEPVDKLVTVWKTSLKEASNPSSFDPIYSLGDRFSDGSFGQGGFATPDDSELNILQRIWNTLTELYSSIVSKIRAIGLMIEYLWEDGVSLFMIPLTVFAQTWDFVLWLLGFTA